MIFIVYVIIKILFILFFNIHLKALLSILEAYYKIFIN